MEVLETGIEGLLLLKPTLYKDHRGYFFESFSEERYDPYCPKKFLQDNESYSQHGVLRGLHFQKSPFEQGKLVRVVSGRVWDVAVDLRPHSPTFKQFYGVELSGENKLQFFIPRGFAHGFLTLSQEAYLQYKCDEYYHPEADGGILWSDPSLSIPWPIEQVQRVILSDKDQALPCLRDF